MKNQNFISADKKTARNSYGAYFEIGEVVKHTDDDIVESAIICSFETDTSSNEVWAVTSKGRSHIDFILKQYRNSLKNIEAEV